MANIEFFKQQSKKFMKDYNTRTFNETEGFYEYSPHYFQEIDELLYDFGFKEDDPFSLMNAQHIIARLSGFYKWNELIQASEAALEIGKLLLINRDNHQFINIVDDWKMYEDQNLQNFDDEAKLEVFKEVFINQGESPKHKAPKLRIDFSDNKKAQDMLKQIMKSKNLTTDKAILSSITQKNCVTILSEGWANIAVSFWGHDDPDRKFEQLDNPIVEIKLSKDKIRLLEIVMEKENVNLEDAILYFMIFKLESLGYHI